MLEMKISGEEQEGGWTSERLWRKTVYSARIFSRVMQQLMQVYYTQTGVGCEVCKGKITDPVNGVWWLW